VIRACCARARRGRRRGETKAMWKKKIGSPWGDGESEWNKIKGGRRACSFPFPLFFVCLFGVLVEVLHHI
jgi:hypothetical protein